MKIGILALQGGVELHALVLKKLGVDTVLVRTCGALQAVDAMILPGGESAVMLKLAKQNGLFQALKACVRHGMPFFGTCAGAILLAKNVSHPPQESLAAVDVTVCRNAYGPQIQSKVVWGDCTLTSSPLEMVFIRAPGFTQISPQVRTLATYAKAPVCVQQGPFLLASFHPELTQDTTLHTYFLTHCGRISE